MKIRSDFVTNSSSSSFTILGKQVNFKDIDLSNGDYICVGAYLSDGDDIFFLNKELHMYLNNQILAAKLINKFEGSILEELTFYKYFLNIYGSGEVLMKELIERIKPEEKFNILNFEKDYSSSTNINDLKNRYGDDD